MQHSFTSSELEVRGKASRTRKQLDSKAEVFQNEIWDAGFDLRPFILENRVNRVLLPIAGDISSTIRVRSQDSDTVLPEPVQIDCSPVKYLLSFQKRKGEIIVEEKLSIRDVEIQPSSFFKFSDFLNQYYETHFWAILLTAP